MAKSRTVYVCAECAAEAPRWMGRCPACGEWNTLGAHVVSGGSAGRRAAPSVETARVERLADVAPGGVERLPTGLAELDRALGGGLVPGGVSLLGGDPGIGKSTLVMQAFAGLARQGRVVLYASGEESAEQVALRGRRLEASGVGDIRLLATTALDDFEAALACKPDHRAPGDTVKEAVGVRRMQNAILDEKHVGACRFGDITAPIEHHGIGIAFGLRCML